MAYEIYITDALVCGSRNSNTSDRSHLLFTREAGMLWASAKSVREERSKHRFALQDFSLVRASLVRGKGGWRITGTEPVVNFYYRAEKRDSRALLRDTTRLLQRFLQGETPVPTLFDDVVGTLRAEITQEFSQESLRYPRSEQTSHVHTILTLRMLHTLGYVSPSHACRPLIEAKTTLAACSLLTDRGRRESERAIHEAQSVSHL